MDNDHKWSLPGDEYMLGTRLSTLCPLNSCPVLQKKKKVSSLFNITQAFYLIQTQILSPAPPFCSRSGKTREAPESVLPPKDLTLQLWKEFNTKGECEKIMSYGVCWNVKSRCQVPQEGGGGTEVITDCPQGQQRGRILQVLREIQETNLTWRDSRSMSGSCPEQALACHLRWRQQRETFHFSPCSCILKPFEIRIYLVLSNSFTLKYQKNWSFI